MKNKIKLLVTNTKTYIQGRLDSDVYQGLRKLLGYRPEGAIFQVRGSDAKWDGIESTLCYCKKYCKCAIKKDGTHFPTGLFNKARDHFVKNSVPFDIFDEREPVAKNISLNMSNDFETRDYQQTIIHQASKMQRGIIKVATGGGKTSIAAGLIAELGISPFIFYVPSVDLLTQTKEEFEKFLRYNNIPIKVGIVGGGKFDVQDITIMTIQTAVLACGKKYVRFDEEDKTKKISKAEKNILSERRKDILDIIMSSKGFIADECITGDSIVVTRSGRKKMSELSNFIGEDILSFDGTSVVWKKITNFMYKGRHSIIKIVLDSGRYIKCTKNHLIKTQKGWVQAGDIKKTDKILSCADVVAEEKLKSLVEARVDTQSISSVIKSEKDLMRIGKKFSKSLSRMLRNVNAAAEEKCGQNIHHWNHLLKIKGQKNTENTFMDMIKGITCGDCHYLKKNHKQFLAHFWEILVYHFLHKEVKLQDWCTIMGYVKKVGQSIRQIFLTDYLLNIIYPRMAGMEIPQFLVIHLVRHVFLEFIRLYIKMVKNESIKSGLISSDLLAWLGGSEMMVQQLIIAYDYIQKDFLYQKSNCALIGLMPNMENQQSINTKKNIMSCIYRKKQEEISTELLKTTSLNTWNTNYVGISSIEDCGSDNVYDITVEDTHCFFANDILVHNCQHWASDTCQVISDYSSNARYRYGMSATPMRDKGDDILIDACFGREIANVSASFLIERGYLVKPDIYFVPIRKGMPGKLFNYQSYYKQGIVENSVRNEYIANMAKSFEENGKNILILCQQVNHGNLLSEMIDGSTFLHGVHSGKQRKAHLSKMRNRDRDAAITIATSIFDEGVDCRPLDTLILAGGGKSKTRALQRVGRVLRPFTSGDYKKESALVIDFKDHCEYLTKHSDTRKRIYKTEPQFNIKELQEE